MIELFVITHGNLGKHVVEAAEAVVGKQREGINVVSVSDRKLIDQIKKSLEENVNESSKKKGIIILTDMIGGTPTLISFPFIKNIKNATVISGINLNMVISALIYRSKIGFKDLVKRIVEDGRKSISDIKVFFDNKVNNKNE
jgi:mannose PTS system EIIA component